jgi:glycosyltransferase 2 family protein
MRGVSIGQSQNISKVASVGSMILERAFDGVVLSLTPFLLLTVLDLAPWIMRVNLTLLLIYVTVLLAIVLTPIGEWADHWWRWSTKVLPRAMADRVASIAEQFFQGTKGIKRLPSLLPISLLCFFCWFCQGLYFFLLFEAYLLQCACLK